MQVKVKNTGTGTRIFTQIGGGEIRLMPGQETECDLPRNLVRAFEIDQETKRNIIIDRMEDDETAQLREMETESTEPKQTFTLRLEENQMQEPQSIREALGQSFPPPPEVEAEHVTLDPALATSAIKDPIGHNAKLQAAAAVADEVVTDQTEAKDEPKTAGELLAAIEAGDLSSEDQMRLANAVLTRKVPKGIKPAGLIKLIKAQAAIE